jgi:hypothetical protein
MKTDFKLGCLTQSDTVVVREDMPPRRVILSCSAYRGGCLKGIEVYSASGECLAAQGFIGLYQKKVELRPGEFMMGIRGVVRE